MDCTWFGVFTVFWASLHVCVCVWLSVISFNASFAARSLLCQTFHSAVSTILDVRCSTTRKSWKQTGRLVSCSRCYTSSILLGASSVPQTLWPFLWTYRLAAISVWFSKLHLSSLRSHGRFLGDYCNPWESIVQSSACVSKGLNSVGCWAILCQVWLIHSCPWYIPYYPIGVCLYYVVIEFVNLIYALFINHYHYS